MENERFCQYGKEIAKRLVDIDMKHDQLIEKVRADTGMYFDRSYLSKIKRGVLATPKIVDSINRILGLKNADEERREK